MRRDANPADATNQESVAERKRVPMGSPVARLAVPEIPGYEQRWILNERQRVQKALDAGYEFVHKDEIQMNYRDQIGSDSAEDGNTSLGTTVTTSAGADLGNDGQPQQLILMKIRKEWYKQDQAAKVGPGSRVDLVRKTLLSGKTSQGDYLKKEDADKTYVKQAEFSRALVKSPSVEESANG